MGGYAWVTLATNDAYSLGALVLAHSLRRVGTKYELAVLITPGVTQTMREKLAAVFSLVQEVNVLDSKDAANLALLARPELGITFTKLHCWRLTQYDKCVFVDADTLVVRNCDELFEREELSAAPDVGWPDCFNSGVFVFKPSEETFAAITAFASAKGSFDGGDQGLLNMYFNDWAWKDISKHLPFIYNMCSTATYSYLPAYKQFGEDVRIIHFIGITKPWLQYFDTLTGIVQPPANSAHLQPLLQLWWNIFCDNVHPQLSPLMATSTLAPIWHKFTPLPFETSVPKNPVYYDTNNEIYSDIYTKEPDFSEFKDPWENYNMQNNISINDNRQIMKRQCHDSINNDVCLHQNNVKKPGMCTESSKKKHCEYHEQFHSTKPHNNVQLHLIHHKETCYQQQHIILDRFHNNQENAYFQSKNNQRIEENTQPFLQNNNNNKENTNDYEYYEKQHNDQHQYYYDEDKERTSVEHHNVHDHQHSKLSSTDKLHSDQQQLKNDNQNYDYSIQQHDQPVINNNDQYFCERQMNENVEKHIPYNDNNITQVLSKSNNDTEHVNHIDNEIITCHVNNELQNGSDYTNAIISNTNGQTDLAISNSTPSPKPCTDLHNVATQSDLNITGHLDSTNAGLAGALAQMTLGEPRTAEQIALEEHMRKQSWEQGQIDYMGRDSFDNIWKKICETLSLAPEQEASPAKDVVQPEASTTDPDSPPSDIKSEIPIAEVASDLREEFLTCNIPTETTEEKEREKNAGLTDPLMQHELLNFCNTSSADVCTPQLSAEGSIIQSLTSTDIGQMLKTSDVDNKQVYTQASASGSLTLGTSKDVILKDSAHTLLEQVGSQDTTLKAPSDSIIPISTKKLEEHLSGVVSGVSLDLTNPPPSTPANNKSEKSISLDTTIDIVAKSESNMSHPSYGDQHILTGQEGGNVLMQGDNQVQTKNTDISNKSDSSTTSCTMSKSIPISPVPIQVAESVLQTEPRESVSEEPKLISEEVISSVDRPVCESAAALSETLIEPTRKTQLSEIPFGTSHEKTGNGICIPEVTSGIVASPSANLDLIDSRKAETAITQASETLKVRETNLDAQPDVCPRVTEDTSKLLCTKENLTKLTGTVQELQGTAPNKQEEAIALDTAQSVSECDTELTKFPKQQETKIPASESVVSPKLEVSSIMSPDPTLDEIPIRPTRTKESSTPPAPPAETTSSPPEAATSDSQNPGKTLKKSGKKVVKKSMSECESTDGADGEGTEKKTVKKVVKKIVKKPKESQDDGAESSSAIEKPKKTTKVIKKTTKPQNSGPQLSETSPPDNSNTPVPPKRKVKAPAPTKVSIAKKPDAEP